MRMDVYVSPQLRECPLLKAKEGLLGGSQRLVLPLLVTHSNGGRKTGRWVK